MIVAIDAGNTRTKWGVIDTAGHMVSQGVVDNIAIDQLPEAALHWSRCRRIVLSSVAGAEVEAQVIALGRALDLPVLKVRSGPSACGVVNRYTDPAQLGSDRWAALVAAWDHYRSPCVVATAGTALTVDALSSRGEFCGGLILPGLRMMRQSLASGTAGLGLQDGAMHTFPLNTADAIHSGALFAMAGAVERLRISLWQREGSEPHCLLSGGDAMVLMQALPSPAKIADNLVLHGLWLMEREHA